IIFCRNVIIYFPRPLQERVLGIVHGLLEDDGVLFSGHSELVHFLHPDFIPKGVAGTFSFRKRQLNDAKTPRVMEDERRAQQQPVATWTAPHREYTAAPAAGLHPSKAPPLPAAPQPAPAVSAQPAPPVAEKIDATLLAARLAADSGRLEEALEITGRLIDREGPSFETSFLLGVVHDALGDLDTAEHHLRRAIYLEPNHAGALTHLALLCEQRGDPSAKLFHRRAQIAVRVEENRSH
ncbi:MAG: hypothetical protein OEY28_08995, partial [Nitrospira sp.]|nr:hypothetical protein [Nitrospira sp.]